MSLILHLKSAVERKITKEINIPADKYMFEVKNRNTRTRCEIY